LVKQKAIEILNWLKPEITNSFKPFR